MPNPTDLSALQWQVLLPQLVLVAAALLVMLLDSLAGERRPAVRALLTRPALVGIAAAAVACVWLWGRPPAAFQDAAVADHFALALDLIVLSAAALTILLSTSYIPRLNAQTGEYYALLLLATLGMTAMAFATDFIVLFLALETFSLALYILAGLHRTNERSTEASIKYFLIGAFASAFFAYGAALIYGATGSTQYAAIDAALAGGRADRTLLYPGIALLVAGFAFKISLVPFHMWTPDVYQGAPTPVTAFMSVGTKAASFAALARVLLVALPTQQAEWGWVLAVLAVLTMAIGNLAALRQPSLKRLLAFSSIAHAGYILVALTPGTAAGANAALFYLFVYTFMNIGAFAVVITLERANEGDALQNRAAGLSGHHPLLALAMALFMLGLSGIPPMGGFFAKVFVFGAAVAGGWAWLAGVALLFSVLGAYYYLRVIVAMYFGEAEEGAAAPQMWGLLRAGIAIAAAFTLAIGVYPAIWANLFRIGG